MASFLRYGVQDNIFIISSKTKREKIKKFIIDTKEELKKYNAIATIIDKRQSESYYRNIISGDFKFRFLVIDVDFLPKRKKDIDNLFYFLSRLGECDEKLMRYNVTCIILGEDIRDFLRRLSDATLSSMQLRTLEITHKV